MEQRGGVSRALLVVLLAAAVLMGAQAAALASTPASQRSTGQVLGETGFAYLGGLRTFAAAVIWNRIDPQFHEYFDGVPLREQAFMVPKMRMVTLLDPQFVDAFYVTSFIVYMRVGPERGIEVAREGVAKNPLAGVLRSNLAQLLFLHSAQANKKEIGALARSVTDADVTWKDEEEQFEGHAIAMEVLRGIGEDSDAELLEGQLAQWRAEGVGAGDHDHDGDGKQDH